MYCGIETARDSLIACVRGGDREIVRIFGTMTADLASLRAWLRENEVVCAAVSSAAGVWRPIHRAISGVCRVVLVRPERATPDWTLLPRGRKAVEMARRLERGELSAAPPPADSEREIHDLRRYRGVVVVERKRVALRLHKVLQDAGIRLGHVVKSILAPSGRAMLDALASGAGDPEQIADLARGNMRRKLPVLREALAGEFGEHHAFLIRELLARIDLLDGSRKRIEGRLASLGSAVPSARRQQSHPPSAVPDQPEMAAGL